MAEGAEGAESTYSGGVVANPAEMYRLQAALDELGETLSTAVQATDALPIDAVRPVVGPVGAEFMAALVSATTRHRQALADAARVSKSAAGVVGGTAQPYEVTDDSTAAALGRAGSGAGTAGTRVVRA